VHPLFRGCGSMRSSARYLIFKVVPLGFDLDGRFNLWADLLLKLTPVVGQICDWNTYYFRLRSTVDQTAIERQLADGWKHPSRQ
jgi:hypothetical protein